PKCSTIFIVYNLEREPTPQTSLFPKLSCPDCGATQYSDRPIAGGKFVRCLACAAVYRVPGPPLAAPVSDPSSPEPERPTPASLPRELPAVVAERVVRRTKEPEPTDSEYVTARRRSDARRNEEPQTRPSKTQGVPPETVEEELSPRERRRLLRRASRDRAAIWVPVLFAAVIIVAAVGLAVSLIVFLRPARSDNLAAARSNSAPAAHQAVPWAGNNGMDPAPGAGQGTAPVVPNEPALPRAGDRQGQRPPNFMPGYPDRSGGPMRPPAMQQPGPQRPGMQQPGPQPPADGSTGPQARAPFGQPLDGIAGGYLRRQQPQDSRPPPAGVALPRTFDVWPQDLEVAKRGAAGAGKDILLLFQGSDWCGFSMRLANDVFTQQEYIQKVNELFVPVYVDFPRQSAAKSRVQNPARNARLAEQYGVHGFPAVVLADSQGLAYGIEHGYQDGNGATYWQRLLNLRLDRDRRDPLLSAVTTSDGLARMEAAEKLLAFLREKHLLVCYLDKIVEWGKLAEKLDPKNADGHLEVFFEAAWLARLGRTDPDDATQVKGLLGSLIDFKKRVHFKNADRGASLLVIGAALLIQVGALDKAMEFLEEAEALGPTDPKLQDLLKKVLGGPRQSSGTGFVVAAGGYIMTNSHVVHGAGTLTVRLPKIKDPIPAQLVAEDRQRDMAVIRVRLPAGVRLQPLGLAERKVQRGENAAVLGYPMGEMLGTGLKLTTGVIGALPEAASDNMYLLDIKVNPGNSGGPLCDAFGNVIGMVTMKTMTDEDQHVDSYGGAIPAPDLLAFLKRSIPGYKPPAKKTVRKEWAEVDTMVSPSVFMIHRTVGG
ncbi:MAG: trypsin-like serine protease, partial [Planctomycetota bacterium]